jgi:hypothetical protein
MQQLRAMMRARALYGEQLNGTDTLPSPSNGFYDHELQREHNHSHGHDADEKAAATVAATAQVYTLHHTLHHVADSLRIQYGHKCSKPCMESLLAALCFSMGLPIDTFSNLNRYGANADGPCVLYIMTFDQTGFERGLKDQNHNKVASGTTKHDQGITTHQLGTSKYQLGTSKYDDGTDAVSTGTTKPGSRSDLVLTEDRGMLSILNADTIAPKQQFRSLPAPARQQLVRSYYKALGHPSGSLTSRTNQFMGRIGNKKRAKLYGNHLF